MKLKEMMSGYNISVDVAMDWLMMEGSTVDIEHVWRIVRGSYIAPTVRICLLICMVMSTMMAMEWAYMGVVITYVKLFGKKSEKRYKWEAMKEDQESGFPMVLVQIPFCNEIEVYKLSIGAVCKLTWPVNRLLIQVLDDSSDILIKEMIKQECLRWGSKGINIRYESREKREGFKAGSLRKGMEYPYIKDYEHVAIFDSDFQPYPDFLLRTIPYLIHNPDIALVQARHTFLNADECLLTRLQEMSFNYHFMAEQEVSSTVFAFFGFNGSAGVWRISAMNEAGGWQVRTAVEDLDLSVQVGLKGWKLLYAGSIEVNCELPSTIKSFRSQQYRWANGPNDLLRQIGFDILKNNKEFPLWKKVYMLYSFFIVRKTVGHTCVFLSYNVILPLAILIPEVDVNIGITIFASWLVTALNVLFTTPRSLHLVGMWVYFESAMSMYRAKAIISGLLGTKKAKEWIVTEKLGDSIKTKPLINKLDSPTNSRFQLLRNRILMPELGIATFLFICTYCDFVHRKDYYCSAYFLLQAITATAVGFSLIGKVLPNY